MFEFKHQSSGPNGNNSSTEVNMSAAFLAALVFAMGGVAGYARLGYLKATGKISRDKPGSQEADGDVGSSVESVEPDSAPIVSDTSDKEAEKRSKRLH